MESTKAVELETAEDEGFLAFVVEFAVEVNEVFSECVPLVAEDPGDELTLFAVTEDGGGAFTVLFFGLLVEVLGFGPVDEGGVVVDDVVVFVPDVVLSVEDGDGVDVLVCWVFGLDEGVPQVAHGSEEGDGFAHGVDEVGDAEEEAGLLDDEGHTQGPPNLAEEDFGGEAVFRALEEEGEAGDACPVQQEAGEPEDVVGEVGAVEIDVAVNIVGVVVPAVVDLVVSGGVGSGHGTVEISAPHGVEAVDDGPWSLEEALVVVAFLVDENLVVSKEAEAGSEADEVVEEHGGELEAGNEVALVGEVGTEGNDGALEDGPWEVRVVAGIDHDDLGGLAGESVDEVAGLSVELAASLGAHAGADDFTGDCGGENENHAGDGDANETDQAHGEPSAVGEEAPGEGALVVLLHLSEDLGEDTFGSLLITEVLLG